MEAAALRMRAYRVERVNADALEAEELYRGAARIDWSGACDAEIDLALVEGELSADPAAEYRALYATRARRRPAPCTDRIDVVLTTLAAFQPPADVLAAIDQDVRGRSPAQPAGSVAIMEPRVPAEQPAAPAEITGLRQYGGRDAGRVVVFLSRPTRFEVGDLAGDATHAPRVFIDVTQTKFHGARDFEGSGLVERVRLGAKGTSTRVVLDLASPASQRAFYLPEPFRLVIDVWKGASPSSDRGPPRVRRVVLDPGHGGRDPGALGPDGLREKDVVLDVAHRAAPLLARELGISTLLTRDADVYVPLDERVARANAFSADLFLSIHCNASESPGSRGVMTFVLDASRDDLASRVAARENASSAEASAELATAMSQVLDPGTRSRSNHFGELLERASLASLAPRYPEIVDLGVKSAGFYVLAGARMPAALFETSFISNTVEERRLDSGDYRQKLADAIVNAVRAYRDGI